MPVVTACDGEENVRPFEKKALACRQKDGNLKDERGDGLEKTVGRRKKCIFRKIEMKERRVMTWG